MKFVEETRETWTAIQLEAVEKEIEQQKRDWEANRLAEQAREEEARLRHEEEENELLTYSREDAKNQVNISSTNTKNSNSSVKSSKTKARLSRDGGRRLSQVRTNQSAEKIPKGKTRPQRNSESVSKKNAATPPKAAAATKTSPLSNKKQQNTSASKKKPTPASSSPNSKKSPRRKLMLKQKTSDGEGAVSNSDDEPLKKKNRKSSAVALPKSLPTSPTKNEDFDDSECSLDVMIDSNDAVTAGNDSDSNQMNHQHHYNNSSQEELDGDELNLTRKTRSRGSVKINLWSLDLSNRKKKTNSKKAGGDSANSSAVLDESVSLDVSSLNDSTAPGAAAAAIIEPEESPEKPPLKELKVIIEKARVLDGFCSSGDERKRPRPASKKATKKQRKSSLGNNHTNTLDGWITKGPKVDLSLEDQEVCKKYNLISPQLEKTPEKICENGNA